MAVDEDEKMNKLAGPVRFR